MQSVSGELWSESGRSRAAVRRSSCSDSAERSRQRFDPEDPIRVSSTVIREAPSGPSTGWRTARARVVTEEGFSRDAGSASCSAGDSGAGRRSLYRL